MNSTWKLYGKNIEDVSIFEISNDERCLPMDGRTRTILFDDVYITLPQEENPERVITSYIYGTRVEGSNRREIIVVQNSLFEDIYKAYFPPIGLFLSSNTDVYIYNNTFSEVSTNYGSMMIYFANNIVMENNTLSSCIDYQFSLVQLYFIFGDITIEGLYLDAVTSKVIQSHYCIHIMPLWGNSITVNDFRVTNSQFYSQNIFTIDSSSYDLFLSNVTVQNSEVSIDHSLLVFDSANMIIISDVIFLNIKGISTDYSDSYMISISNLNLASSNDSTIQNITVQEASLGFFNFESIMNEPTQSRQFKVVDVSIINSQYTNRVDIFSFGRISISKDFTIQMVRTHFESLSFKFGGNLINMQALINNGVVVTDSKASDIKGGSLRIEAFNKQSLTIPAKLSKLLSL